jgi:hypothetical protein
MANIDHLYNDPDWMLQAGLGDIEFEQDMYDDIMYGKPSDELSAIERSKLMEGLGTSLYDYDDMALMGLRKHTMEGPMRYLYDEDQKKGRLKESPEGNQYWGQYTDVDDPFDPSDDSMTKIDLNLNEVIGDWDPSQGPLQDFISDVYRHEYKHPLWDKYLGIRENKRGFFSGKDTGVPSKSRTWKAFTDKYQPYAPGEVQHIPIYATGALFGKNPLSVRDAYKKVGNMGQKELGWGGDLMRTARYDAERAGMLPDMHTGEFLKHDQHPHRYPNQGPPGRDYSTGGLASLAEFNETDPNRLFPKVDERGNPFTGELLPPPEDHNPTMHMLFELFKQDPNRFEGYFGREMGDYLRKKHGMRTYKDMKDQFGMEILEDGTIRQDI